MNREDLKSRMKVLVPAKQEGQVLRLEYTGVLVQPYGAKGLVTEKGSVCVQHSKGVSYVPLEDVKPLPAPVRK